MRAAMTRSSLQPLCARLRLLLPRLRGGGLLAVAGGAWLLLASGCWSPSATEGLPCEADSDCAGDQTCSDVGQCVAAGSSGRPTSGPCTAEDQGRLRCSDAGDSVLEQCTSGQWEQISCNTLCQNQLGTCGQAGVCRPGIGDADAGCSCATEALMACDTTQGPQGSCSAADTYQFCDMETSYELRQTCDCLCAQFGYPSQGVGPCVAGPGNDCYCADSKGSTCAMQENGVRTCLADALGYEECVVPKDSMQGTRYRTDCFAECERRGYTGAPYAVCDEAAPGGPDCVCEDPNG